MTSLETEMKELVRSTHHNTHDTRSLIRTLKYVSGIVSNRESLYVERA